MEKTHEKLLLVVVAKAPVPGAVKTRLSPEFTSTEATDLYRCFIRDRIKEISYLTGVDLAISYTPENSDGYFAKFISNGFQLFPQRGKDLGERLSNIFLDKLAGQYDAVSIIDSDTPDLPRSIVEQSFQLLVADGADAVFGPCYDGGYYLIGLRKAHPELFQNIPWSTEKVLPQTLEKAHNLGLETKLLPPWNDLDTFQDLLEYYQKFQEKPGEADGAGRQTFKFLANLKRISQNK